MKPKIILCLALLSSVPLPGYSDAVKDANADQWRQRLLGLVRIQISVAGETKRSEGLPFRFQREFGLGSDQRPAVMARAWLEDDLSGIPIHSRPPPGDGNYEELNLSAGPGNGWGRILDLTNARYAKLQPGPQTYHYCYHIEVVDSQETVDKTNSGKPLCGRVIEGTIPWRLLSENQTPPLPSLRSDPSLAAGIRQSMRVYVLRDIRDTTLVQVSIQADHPPTSMGFDMSLRAGPDTWPLGPVAWADGEIMGWHNETDLPEDIKKVEVVLTPSAQAAAKLKRDNWFQLIKLNEVWSGPPIVLGPFDIQHQEFVMVKIEPPATPRAREYAMKQLEQADPVVQQLRSDGDWAKAAVQLKRTTEDHPNDVRALYDLGCILTADGDFSSSMKAFAAVKRSNPSPRLSRQSRRQLRRICAIYRYRAEENEDREAMCALGAACEHGVGVGQDVQEAKRWYRNAANAGDPNAMCHLASMYEHETGATVHTDKAHKWYQAQALQWYQKAASLENEEAKKWLSGHDHP